MRCGRKKISFTEFYVDTETFIEYANLAFTIVSEISAFTNETRALTNKFILIKQSFEFQEFAKCYKRSICRREPALTMPLEANLEDCVELLKHKQTRGGTSAF